MSLPIEVPQSALLRPVEPAELVPDPVERACITDFLCAAATVLSAEPGVGKYSISALGALMHLRDSGPLTNGEQVARTGLSSAGVTCQFDVLVRRGWVERRISKEDRRIRIHSITSDGVELLEKIEARAAECRRQREGTINCG